MRYDDLTDEQKADIARHDSYMRSNCSRLLAIYADPGVWFPFIAANVDPLLDQLDDDEIIPNSTNLAGAKDLTVAEYKGLKALLGQIAGASTSGGSLLVKAVGVNSGI